LIPHTCQYCLFDLEGNFIEGDFSHDEVVEAELYIKGSYESDYRFYLIERENGYCIIKYDLSARFSSPILQKLFPNVELIFIIMFLLIFVSIVLYSAFSFGKKLRKELNPLLEEIGQIQSKELNMERKYSKIKEFNDILLSLYDMEIALTESLKKEWETEQSIKSNISSIAHDIKTPLTIIKGNSELIKEEDSMEEIYHSAEIINSNTDKIERYIKLLIDMTRYNQVEYSREVVELSTLVNEIIDDSDALCKTSGVELITCCADLSIKVMLDKESIERAIINLVQNAIEHTATHKMIKLSIDYSEEKLRIEVEDFGEGFSEEALKNAKKQFYTEKIERSEEHYGLGLYFVDKIANRYNGSVTLFNKQNQSGAIVIFEVIVKQKD
jgi:signal transduction histidine kinase